MLRAVDCTNARIFGLIMNESHASMRDDFQMSVPEIDHLVALLQKHPDVYGARMTGGGFGGACVALCESNALQEVAAAVLADYALAGFQGRLLVPAASEAEIDAQEAGP